MEARARHIWEMTDAKLSAIGGAATVEKYRDALMKDPGAVENVNRVERTGCILNEERSLVERVP